MPSQQSELKRNGNETEITLSHAVVNLAIAASFYIVLASNFPKWKRKERSSEDHMATNGGERNATDGKDLEPHISYGEGSAEVEGTHVAALHTTRRNGHE